MKEIVMGFWAETRQNIFLFIIVVIAAYWGWSIYDRFAGSLPVMILESKVINPNVRAGEQLSVQRRILRKKFCEYDLTYIFRDSTGRRESYSEPHVTASAGRLGEDAFVRDYRIPNDLAPGPATLVVNVAWACPENLYEAVYPMTVTSDPINFNVLPPADGKGRE